MARSIRQLDRIQAAADAALAARPKPDAIDWDALRRVSDYRKYRESKP